MESTSKFRTHGELATFILFDRKVGTLFEAEDDIEEYLENLGLDKQKAQFLLYANRPIEAARAYLLGGEPLQAFDILVGTRASEHITEAGRILLEEMLTSFPIQHQPTEDKSASELLERAHIVSTPALNGESTSWLSEDAVPIHDRVSILSNLLASSSVLELLDIAKRCVRDKSLFLR